MLTRHYTSSLSHMCRLGLSMLIFLQVTCIEDTRLMHTNRRQVWNKQDSSTTACVLFCKSSHGQRLFKVAWIHHIQHCNIISCKVLMRVIYFDMTNNKPTNTTNSTLSNTAKRGLSVCTMLVSHTLRHHLSTYAALVVGPEGFKTTYIFRCLQPRFIRLCID